MESTDRSLFYQKAVLESVFANAAVMSTVVERVSAHMFEDENLGLIFRGMVSLFNKGIGIDPLLIDREMKLLDAELYSKMGGLNYDMKLFTCVKVGINQHISINVMEMAIKAALDGYLTPEYAQT